MLYSFGPFSLDTEKGRLLRDGEPVALGGKALGVLGELVAMAGRVVSKDALIKAAWDDVAVTDNSLEQAISMIRRTLGSSPRSGEYIQTVPRSGYRFVVEVSRPAPRQSDETLHALLAPHQIWLEGRAALETLSAERAAGAERAFETVLEISPAYAPARVGLANACVFRFESTRADERPDAAALARALECANEACRLDPAWGEAWATLGFVLQRAGRDTQALAALRRAVSMEPENWRHHLRLGLVSWGEERLRAAANTLRLLPGLGLAHWLAATVHVARQAFDLAERELASGAAAQDEQTSGGGRFGAVGLHWLHGLVRLERGDRHAARNAFERELSFEPAGHLYARECCANTWYAIGAMHLREGRPRDAASAMAEALRRVPGHPSSLVALSQLGDRAQERMDSASLTELPSSLDAALVKALHEVLRGHHLEAATLVRQAFADAPPGSAGWTIPVEPLLEATRHDAWQGVLAVLRSRAA